MINFNIKTNSNGEQILTTSVTGDALLNCPQLNKGTAFTQLERHQFGLLGKLPLHVETIEEQLQRAYAQYQSYETPKQKNIFLHELYNTNQVLFFKLVKNYLEEMTPIIYTPHVATACQTFSNEFRRPQGLYISYPEQEHLAEIIDNRPIKDVDLIVVTDGERILGIGDQGVGGMGIPVGKLMLYSLFGGINPLRTLPIVLDVGTNNEKLLQNPHYLGWRNPRISGEKYDKFIEKFVKAVKEKLPNVFLQWEDFGRDNAARNLEKYRKTLCSFNDDIQGTAVVTLSALLAAVKTIGQKISQQRIAILGAGSAAIGVANLIHQGMVREGLSAKEAQQNFWVIDINGLLTDKSTELSPQQKFYARNHAETAKWQVNNPQRITLAEVVKEIKPTILLGFSTAGGAFTESIVREMSQHVEHPIIFPLSNPTSSCEAIPEDLIKWTDGKALIATGSPFAPVIYKEKTYTIAQCNNSFVFPGIGLGTIVSKAKEVSDEMLWSASQTLLHEAPSLHDNLAPLLPPITQAAAVARKIGLAVATQAINEDLARIDNTADLQKLIEEYYWNAAYLPLALK